MVNLQNEKETINFLKNFEKEIAQLYEEGKIKAPIHLEGSINNSLEIFLIRFFRENNINNTTWVCASHRAHFPWLLSGRDPKELKKQILEGHSMHIFGHKFFTSAIVGGVAPIALGVAKGLVMKGSKEKVYCFLGDMAFSCGLVQECIRYSKGWDLPITYIILDNLYSVNAMTSQVWGIRNGQNKTISCKYKRLFPHSGTGKYIMW